MKNNHADKPLMITIFALVIFGLVMIFSAGIALSLNNFGEPYHYFYHQLFYGIIPGLVFWMIFQNIDYHRLEKFAFPFFIFALVTLILVLIPGIGQVHKGAARWLVLGPISFQPTEVAKLAMILYLAAWFASKRDKIRSFMEGFFPFLGILAVMSLLVFMQPDVGTLGMIVIISMVIFFLASGKLSHLASLLMVGIVALFFMVKLAPYRMARLTVFLNPGTDPQGIGYQINQALIAIGSGGLWGIGLGHGRQKFLYLPEPVGDSIYAILCEELGLIGGVVLVLLFIVIGWRGFMITKKAPDFFGKLVAGGITAWITFQAFINIAAITSLMPLTGIPLPFVSYGGSALIIVLIASGILLNISKKITP
ncbi:MAG: putative lipid II flippase FtsW [Patescibacteria group bacterium]|nr:putative lipid II flippase FtsW [Patescibacteria group bacterium]